MTRLPPRPASGPSNPYNPPPPPPVDSARRGALSGRRITLGVTGSIAAYKAASIARLLVQDGAEVRVVLTPSAEEFIGGATFAGITGGPVLRDMFDPLAAGESHLTLAAESDLILVAPATADTLARMAQGRADDLITAAALCAKAPVIVAPAMHPNMWSHPATQRSIATLKADARVECVGPVLGEVASGEVGHGRMADPEQIAAAVVRRLARTDLASRNLVISAGPTMEDLDPVRFLANRSSGKMGFALAAQAVLRGARVTLVAGPVALPTPPGVTRIDVRGALAMRGAIWQALGPDLSNADALIMAAAVSDYRPAAAYSSKLKRDASSFTIELTQNPDILAEVGHARRGPHPILVGFALETDTDERVIAYAHSKLEQKRVDLVVANHAGDALERDDNRAAFVTATDHEPLVKLTKTELANRMLDWISQHLAQQTAAR